MTRFLCTEDERRRDETGARNCCFDYESMPAIRRRSFLSFVGGLVLATVTGTILDGCGASNRTVSLAPMIDPAVVFFVGGSSVGAIGAESDIISDPVAPGTPIFPLLAARDVHGEYALVYGTQTANGLPSHITQIVHWAGADATKNIRVYYASVGSLPIEAVDSVTGHYLYFSYGYQFLECNVVHFDETGLYVGAVGMTISSNQVTQITPEIPETKSKDAFMVRTRSSAVTRAGATDAVAALVADQATANAPIKAVAAILTGAAEASLVAEALSILQLSADTLRSMGEAIGFYVDTVQPALTSTAVNISTRKDQTFSEILDFVGQNSANGAKEVGFLSVSVGDTGVLPRRVRNVAWTITCRQLYHYIVAIFAARCLPAVQYGVCRAAPIDK